MFGSTPYASEYAIHITTHHALPLGSLFFIPYTLVVGGLPSDR